jgi:hypothetical protein
MTEAFGEVTGGAMGMGDPRSSFDAVTIDASDHCSRKSTEEGASAPSANGLPAPTSLAAQFLTKPCPPECGTGAVSFAQLQRSRETAALARALRPRPPTVSLQSRFIEVNLFTAIAWQKRIRPRGPPLSFS